MWMEDGCPQPKTKHFSLWPTYYDKNVKIDDNLRKFFLILFRVSGVVAIVSVRALHLHFNKSECALALALGTNAKMKRAEWNLTRPNGIGVHVRASAPHHTVCTFPRLHGGTEATLFSFFFSFVKFLAKWKSYYVFS